MNNHNVNITIVLHLWVNMLCCQFKIYPYLCIDIIREAAKKSSFFLVFLATKRGVKAGTQKKEKNTFVEQKKKFRWPLNSRGGANLSGRATKKSPFFKRPL